MSVHPASNQPAILHPSTPYPSIHSSHTHALCIHPSVHLSIHQSVCSMSVHQYIHPVPIHPFFSLSCINPSILCPFVCHLIYRFIHSPIILHLFTNAFMHPFVYPTIHLFLNPVSISLSTDSSHIHPLILYLFILHYPSILCPFIHFSIHSISMCPSINQSIHLSIHQPHIHLSVHFAYDYSPPFHPPIYSSA